MLELLVVLAVSGILLGIGVAFLPRQNFAVNEVARILAADLTRARTEAIKLNTNVAVRLSSTGYSIFIDSDKNGAANRDYAAGDDAYNELDLNRDGTNDVATGTIVSFDAGDRFGHVALSTIRITGGGDTVWFDVRGLPRGATTASAAATITITGGKHARQVQLGSQGRVLVVTP